MARRAQGGWKLRKPEGRDTHLVRFRHNGERIERSTGESDPDKAAIEAARIYADTVSGRRTTRVAVAADLDKAAADFLADYGTTHAEGTAATAEMYFSAHFLPHFGSFDRFTPASIGDYMRDRTRHVTRSTLRKELSVLRVFFAWLLEHGAEGLPVVPALPKAGHPGTRHKQARRPASAVHAPAIVKRLLMAMPERSRRTGDFVRPLFEVLWETGLRESTLFKLRAPEHYTRGAARLFVSRDIDKAHYERGLPLTENARRALDRVTPRTLKLDAQGRGPLLFPGASQSGLRDSLEAAARAAGIEGPISPYDLRHSRASQLANSGAPLAGVARLLGHRHVSTTAIYVHGSDDAAQAALDAVAPRRRAPRRTPQTGAIGGHSGGHMAKTSGAKEGT